MEWLPIIFQFLQPMLAKCFSKSEAAAQDPQEYLRENYNPETGRMDPSLVRRSMGTTRKAIKKAHRQASREERKTFPRYTRDEVYDMTEKKLVEALKAPKEQVEAAFALAAELPDDE